MTREERYERCLRDVHRMLSSREEELERSYGCTREDCSELVTLAKARVRIARTLRRQPLRPGAIGRLLSAIQV